MSLTEGNLFDGIGGFPLAAQHAGIQTLWVSEIEAFPIRVTKVRFPEMVHVGDITKLKGVDLPPVDIVYGGFGGQCRYVLEHTLRRTPAKHVLQDFYCHMRRTHRVFPAQHGQMLLFLPPPWTVPGANPK